MSNTKEFKIVNHFISKIDGLPLAQGKSLFTGDLTPQDALHIKILWSPVAHAKIKSIDISEAEKMPGVKCVLYYGNVPRIPHTTAGQGYPEPSPYDTYMFDNKARFVGDRIAAVAAETREQAENALKKIKVEYEILEPVLDIDSALKENAPIIHDEEDSFVPIPVPYEPKKNIVSRIGMEVGEFEKALNESEYVFDEIFETQYVQHCALEGYISWAQIDSYGRVVITTSTQVPFHIRRLVARTLDIPLKRIRIVKPRIGGGFGSKQELMLEDIVALVALRTGRAAFCALTRPEIFRSGRTRHPMRIRMRCGLMKNGVINAVGMDIINNTGAYGGHALAVMSCSGGKTLPLYHCNNIHFNAVAVYTNLPVAGAYRGYGATQAFFALESMIDIMAEKLGMCPVEFRKRNHIKLGEGHPAFEALGEGKPGAPMTINSSSLSECIELGAKEIGWHNRRPHTEKSGRYRRGLGMCILMQGSSIPEIDMGAASIKMNEDGSFNLLVGATDVGTGSDTILAQIAAEELATTVDKFIVYSSDTDMTPFDVGAYASSTTYLTGEAVRKAAAKVKNQILSVGAKILNKKLEDLDVCDSYVIALDGSAKVSYSEIALYSLYERDQFQIAAIESHITNQSPAPFAAHFVEVEVDVETGKTRVLKYVATVDCGTPINPKFAEGQTEGAILNGISFALTEEYRFDDKGKVINANFANYNIFSLRDKPEIKVFLVPSYEKSGPFGAKSIGEISINGGLPAIANAIYNAIGVRLYKAPFTQERVWRAIQKLKK